MKKRVLHRAVGDPESLIALLGARLDILGPAADELVAEGAVYVGNQRATEDRAVAIGDKIVVYQASATPTRPPTIDVVHRDDWIAIVNKPAGTPSQAERTQHAAALDAQLARALGHPVWLMHRLDKEASGLVLFATRRQACASLQRALGDGRVDRRYVAIVGGELRGDGVIELRIARHPTDSRLRAALPEHAPAGEPACSRYRALAHGRLQGRALTAVALQLDTGRTHQLRVHLQGIGHPIVGDVAYGGPSFERLCLHAHTLALPHPRSGAPVHASAPLPDAFARLVPGLTSPLT
jgi:23S rRNA pseudouridine1911/1915/1917 synthase